jgi:nicotinate-nucleotide adenylyltransferase
LCATASDVYDIQPSNVESGLDYHKQECTATHLQDIAVRRVLVRLGRSFKGDHLVQIRGHESEGYRLNPGKVPFHEPESIIEPTFAPGRWWDAHSVEDFWQSNKVLEVRASEPVLRSTLLRNLGGPDPEVQRIAMFGGSFNPIHLGHLRIAQDLLDLHGFAKVIFVPNGNGYRKKGLIDEAHRARMVELAIEGEPRFELCRFELGRTEVVYTLETVQHLETTLPAAPAAELHVIRGSDVVTRMLRWPSLPALLRHHILVVVRPNFDPWEKFGKDETFRLHNARFSILPRPFEDGLSSSYVRERLLQGQSIRYLVPETVRNYIAETRCYG